MHSKEGEDMFRYCETVHVGFWMAGDGDKKRNRQKIDLSRRELNPGLERCRAFDDKLTY